MKKNFSYIIISLNLFLWFLIIYLLVESGLISSFDEKVYSIFHINKFTTTIMKFITFFAEPKTIIYFSVVMILIIRSWKIKFFTLINPLISLNIFHFVKIIVKRPRPEGINLLNLGGYSFPSGHSFLAVTFYGFLIFLINRKVKKKSLKITLTTVLVILIISILASRVYLGVHYASDVLAGMMLSIFYYILFIKLIYTKKPIKVPQKLTNIRKKIKRQ